MSYYYGNLAVKEERKQQPRYRETRTKVTRQIAIPAQEKLLYLIVILLCVFIAGSVIARHAQIYDVNTQIQQMEREIESLQKENHVLRIEVNKLRDPKRMLEIGRQMGLTPIEDENIRQIVARTN